VHARRDRPHGFPVLWPSFFSTDRCFSRRAAVFGFVNNNNNNKILLLFHRHVVVAAALSPPPHAAHADGRRVGSRRPGHRGPLDGRRPAVRRRRRDHDRRQSVQVRAVLFVRVEQYRLRTLWVGVTSALRA